MAENIVKLASIYVDFMNKIGKSYNLSWGNWRIKCSDSAVIPTSDSNGMKVFSVSTLCLSPSNDSSFNRELVKRIYESIDQHTGVCKEDIAERNEKIDSMTGNLVICYYHNENSQFLTSTVELI